MSTYQDLAPDPTTVEIYKGIDCCDEIQTELQSIIQDITSLRGLITQQHGALEQKLQTLEQQIQNIQTRVNAIWVRVTRLQGDFARYVQQFNQWMNWIATALSQINNCTCGANTPLPPPPGKIG